jgi:hypothetical protein
MAGARDVEERLPPAGHLVLQSISLPGGKHGAVKDELLAAVHHLFSPRQICGSPTGDLFALSRHSTYSESSNEQRGTFILGIAEQDGL